MIKGIDVSNYQSETYDLTGVDFVIVKATQSTNYVNPKHDAQVARARAAGRVVGHYHFIVTGNIAAQAAYFVQHAAPKPGELLACDWETNPATSTAPTNAEKDQFIRAVKALRPGLRVLLYTGQNFWLTKDTTSYAGDGLWIAQYNGDPGKPDIKAKWLIHQYTSQPLDTNVAAFASRAEMAAWAAGEEPDVALTQDDADLVVDRLLAADKFDAPKDAADYSDDPKDPGHYWSGRTVYRDLVSRVRRVDGTTAALTAQVAALTSAVAALAQGGGLTAAEVQAAAEAGAKAALDQLGAKLQED
ncbi:glycoside hydrolase family 25 protein [Streptomyces sp. NPDC051016]|uniref:glycoside hydrolase family 25 protein n=1 Tax=Streptomyces sp. NPDC051016 TaxID=3365638 RepID=UPI00379D2430